MSDERSTPNLVRQLIDVALYAPIGLVYEYEEVVPKLVTRGRSQVQLARVLGQMAVRSGEGGRPGSGDVVNVVSMVAARAITELGSSVGLAPPRDGSGPSEPPPAADRAEDKPIRPLPIAGYDDLNARQVIELVDDLTPEERERIEVHERANRNRKTVLAKIERARGG